LAAAVREDAGATAERDQLKAELKKVMGMYIDLANVSTQEAGVQCEPEEEEIHFGEDDQEANRRRILYEAADPTELIAYCAGLDAVVDKAKEAVCEAQAEAISLRRRNAEAVKLAQELQFRNQDLSHELKAANSELLEHRAEAEQEQITGRLRAESVESELRAAQRHLEAREMALQLANATEDRLHTKAKRAAQQAEAAVSEQREVSRILEERESTYHNMQALAEQQEMRAEEMEASMREMSLALNKEIDRRMRQEMDGDVDLQMQRAAETARGQVGGNSQARSNGGRAGGLDALFLGLPRGDPQHQQQLSELKAIVNQLRQELEKKRFEVCCYIRRAQVPPLTAEELASDRARLQLGGPEKKALQAELFEKMDRLLQETMVENANLRGQLEISSEQLLNAQKRERAASPVKARMRIPPPPPRQATGVATGATPPPPPRPSHPRPPGDGSPRELAEAAAEQE